MNKNYLLLLMVIHLSLNIFGQTAELEIDKKHSVNFQVSTDLGSIEIPDRYYEFNDSLFFIVKPKGYEHFSKGDLKAFKAIKIQQSEHYTSSGRIFGITNGSKKIKKILIVFSRSDIDITKKFEFIIESHTSDAFGIPEQYWPHYTQFINYYNTGKLLYKKKKYIEAFKQLQNILPGSENYLSYINFSTNKTAYDILIPDIITGYQEKHENILQELKVYFNSLEKLSDKELFNLEIKKDSVILINEVFEPYYRITESTNIDLRQKHEKLINEYNKLYATSYETWKKTILKVLETGKYGDENKYSIYIELLSKLLIYNNHIQLLSGYDSLNISLILNPNNEISFLKSHIDILELMEWKNEFITILKLLNEEIATNTRLISQTNLLNLRANMMYERQPNYYIIYGFNELVKGNFETFKDNILLAIAKCTDKELLYYLELWYFSYRFITKDINQGFLDKINAGLDFEKKCLPNDAKKQYEMAKRIESNCALPAFLIGKIKLEIENEIHISERYFDEAINIYQSFALARIYHLELLINNNQYSNALNEIEAVLNISNLSIWYIYYLKAKVLYLQEKYNPALEIIQNKCTTLNSNNFDQFILLGDIYLALKDCESAKENYQNAGDIDPDNAIFSERMEQLILQCNK